MSRGGQVSAASAGVKSSQGSEDRPSMRPCHTASSSHHKSSSVSLDTCLSCLSCLQPLFSDLTRTEYRRKIFADLHLPCEAEGRRLILRISKIERAGLEQYLQLLVICDCICCLWTERVSNVYVNDRGSMTNVSTICQHHHPQLPPSQHGIIQIRHHHQSWVVVKQ